MYVLDLHVKVLAVEGREGLGVASVRISPVLDGANASLPREGPAAGPGGPISNSSNASRITPLRKDKSYYSQGNFSQWREGK